MRIFFYKGIYQVFQDFIEYFTQRTCYTSSVIATITSTIIIACIIICKKA